MLRQRIVLFGDLVRMMIHTQSLVMKMMIMMMEMIHIYLLVKKLFFTQQSKSLTPSLIRYGFGRAGCNKRGNYHITEEALER